MATCANVENANLDIGTFCPHGLPRGFAIFEDSATVANSSLNQQTYWDAQVYDGTNRAFTVYGSDDAEIIAAEVQKYTPKFGFGVKTSKNSNQYVIKFKDTECLRNTLFPLDMSEVNVMFFMSERYIRGLKSSALNTKTVKATISVSTETVDDVPLLVTTFEFSGDFEANYVDIQLESGFEFEDITGLTSVYLEAVSATQTVITVLAYDCARTALTGLADANFVLYNLTDDPTKSTPITGTVVATANSYAITIASQDVSENVVTEIATPAAANLYITGESVVQTTV